jgi:hypothetical protein
MGVRAMDGMDEKGKVAPGETFEWENYSDSDCTITGTGNFLTLSTYLVKAKTGPTSPGTTPATVKSPLADGSYTYSASNNTKRSQPTIHVNSGKP